MLLYTYFRSSAAFRVRIALNLKGQAYESSAISLPKGAHRKDDFGAINPQKLVPAVIEDGHLLTQSLAIMEYLEEKQPLPPLLPKDLLGRARVRSLSLLIACEIHPLNNLRVLQHLKRGLGQDEAAINTWCSLALGRVTHFTLSVFYKCYNGRRRSASFTIWYHHRLIPFHYCNARVSCSKVNSYYFFHDFFIC